MSRPVSDEYQPGQDGGVRPSIDTTDETAALQGANWLIAFMAGMLLNSLLWAGSLLLRAAGVL